jgi:peptidoglycan glycosyltransferase
VNDPIRRVFGVFMVMLLLLVGSTSWWTIVRANDLNHKHADQNTRAQLRGLKVKRGVIRADDGTILARSVRTPEGIFSRRYPTGPLFGHTVGYSYTTSGQSGLEQYYDDDLSGKRGDVETLLDQLRGRSTEGDRLQTTLDPRAQRIAIQQLAGRKGSVVALDPRTGAIKAMVSEPGFDPNDARDAQAFRRLQSDEAGSPLFNRATQAGYPPGSTFKVVTTIAAIDSGKFTPQSQLDGKSPRTVSGTPLKNDAGESFGVIDLTTALTKSVNTVYAQVAERIGAATMKDYMERLGFDKKPPLDYPRNQIAASGLYTSKGKRLAVTSGQVDIGRVGIGQERLRVTPLQMAMVAAAVANGGKLMKPHFGDKVVDADGRTVRTIQPEVYSQAMSSSTAAQVRDMMGKVVEEGTGTAAALQGISVAGKTGTAEIDIAQNITQPWFIAFAPKDNPRIAVAATVERTQGGFGGVVAAPVAKAVMESLLGG